jgi:hypothetical protein
LGLATTRDYLDVFLPLYTKSKQQANHNAQANIYLTLACKEDIIFGIVGEAGSTDFPKRDARIAWTGLKPRSEYKKF